MRKLPRYWFALALALLSFTGVTTRADAPGDPPYQTDFPPDEFKARWARIYDQIGDKAVAVVQGVGLTPGFMFPRQHNEFYYLCGVETAGAYLMLDGRSKTATLYLPKTERPTGSVRRTRPLGRRCGAGEAADRRGPGAAGRGDA